MYSGTVVLGAATTTTAAIVLPNTGSNTLLTVSAAITMAVGVIVLASSIARIVAKRAYKA